MRLMENDAILPWLRVVLVAIGSLDGLGEGEAGEAYGHVVDRHDGCTKRKMIMQQDGGARGTEEEGWTKVKRERERKSIYIYKRNGKGGREVKRDKGGGMMRV